MTARELCDKIAATARDQEKGLLDLCSVCPQRRFFLALVVNGVPLRVFRLKARADDHLYIRCLAFDDQETTQMLRRDDIGPPAESQIALASKLLRELLRLKREVAGAVYNLVQACPQDTFDLYSQLRSEPTFIARFWAAKHWKVLGADFADGHRHYFRSD